jgi:hypothetical protein
MRCRRTVAHEDEQKRLRTRSIARAKRHMLSGERKIRVRDWRVLSYPLSTVRLVAWHLRNPERGRAARDALTRDVEPAIVRNEKTEGEQSGQRGGKHTIHAAGDRLRSAQRCRRHDS